MNLPRRKRRGVQVEWEGVTYPSFMACARATGLSSTTIASYYSNGWVRRSDVPPWSNGEKPVTWNGINYPSLTACGEATGVSYTTVANRIEAGKSCDADCEVEYSYEWRGSPRVYYCEVCAAEIRITSSNKIDTRNHYCSRACHVEYKRISRLSNAQFNVLQHLRDYPGSRMDGDTFMRLLHLDHPLVWVRGAACYLTELGRKLLLDNPRTT